MNKRAVAEAMRDLQWLQSQAEWGRYRDFLQKNLETRLLMLRRLIRTPEEQAEHNKAVGAVEAFRFLLDAPDVLLSLLEQEAEKLTT